MSKEELLPAMLTVGRNYRIIYHNPTDRLPREMVATYLGQDAFGDASGDTLYFSGRPTFGTTALPIAWVKEMWTTSKQIMVPTVYRGEERVY